jgi:sugar lactone lactonase YvrE
MRRFFTLVCLLCLAIPAGISISGCTRNPGANYCNGLGYGPKNTDLNAITLQPQFTGISLAFGQTRQVGTPTATTCVTGQSASVSTYTYGTTNNLLVDISPSGNICAGRWNRNSGGGIADYTTCYPPSPLPKTNGLPYTTAYITASADAVTSNPVEVYVHAEVSSVTLALSGTQQCNSQGTTAQLDAEACYSNGTTQLELCAPSSVTKYACANPSGVTVPNCSTAIGTMSYSVGTSTIASINSETNVITAEQPGTTLITASVAGSGSSAGYFSTCPPKSISVTLNGGTGSTTPITVTKGVTQNLTTTILDTHDQTITGLSLDYQSTDPIDMSVGSAGVVSPTYPGQASVYAICQPPNCNSTPINQLGLYGTGLPVSSNAVNVVAPGTASDYIWFSAPGQSQYFVPVDLLNGTVGSTVRLPYVPNSMVMDRLGSNLYFGSSHELMIYTTGSNTLSKEETGVPGVVLAVSPDNANVLVNDQTRQLFYIVSVAGNSIITYGGLGNAAAWTPDAKTLYITDSASLGGSHTDTLYVYSQESGFTTYSLSGSGGGLHTPAITIPSVGAYLSGASTVAHTWCPTGTVGNSASMSFYPQGDSVAAQTDVLAATTDGQHILGAAMIGGGVTLSDIGVTIPTGQCPPAISNVLQPLNLTHTLNQQQLSKVNATAVDQVVTSPASNLAFVTYTGTTPGALLPYYVPVSGGAAGTVNYVTLMNGSSASTTVTAPLTGAFSPDDKLFFVSTAGDNMIHYIDVPTLKDTQQISPNLPGCTPGTDSGCTLPSTTTQVPATAIAVKPRTTT